MEVKRFPRLHDKIVEVVINLLQRRLPSTNEMVTLSANFEYSSTLPEVDCKTVVFSSKSVKNSVKRGVRVLSARRVRASHDCSRVLEYAKIRKKTVLQSIPKESFFRLLDFSVLKKTKASFSKDFGDGNEGRLQKALAKQQVCTCITLFCTFLCRPFTSRALKCLISRFMEDVNKRRRIFLSRPKLGWGPQEIHSREIRLPMTFSANWNKRDKVWIKRILFKSDSFAYVAVVDAKAP